MRDISKNIKQLRVQKGMTQDELAEALFVTRQTVSNYETGRSRPDVDMLVNIASALDTDVNTVIYGVSADEEKQWSRWSITAAAAVPLILLAVTAVLFDIGKERAMYFDTSLNMLCLFVLRPLAMLVTGWCAMYLLGQLFKFKPLSQRWTKWACIVVLLMCLFLVFVSGLYMMEMFDISFGISYENTPGFTAFLIHVVLIFYDKPWIYPILGAALWIFGFPKKKEKKNNEAIPE